MMPSKSFGSLGPFRQKGRRFTSVCGVFLGASLPLLSACTSPQGAGGGTSAGVPEEGTVIFYDPARQGSVVKTRQHAALTRVFTTADDELAEELRSRAHAHLAEKEIEYAARRQDLGVTDELVELPGLTGAMLVTLGEAGIKTLDDLADLAGDELTHSEEGVLREFGLSETDANEIIMAARAHWFDDEPETPAEDLADGTEDAASDNSPAAG